MRLSCTRDVLLPRITSHYCDWLTFANFTPAETLYELLLIVIPLRAEPREYV